MMKIMTKFNVGDAVWRIERKFIRCTTCGRFNCSGPFHAQQFLINRITTDDELTYYEDSVGNRLTDPDVFSTHDEAARRAANLNPNANKGV